MDKSLIERINFLARKKKAEGLTEEEAAEQAALRREYIALFRQGMEAQLKQIYIQNEEGEYEPLRKKEER
ncbi:MAG TPA: DUF896 domain-containing protein [Candidatus Limnocylindria bacterium]|nr:DUF896 domain-containing protein [Candidatus Limnocylindria bacterium]